MAIEGFDHSFVETNGITLSVHRGGHGTPLILLHGFPQNHHCWAKIAPVLAQDYDVIVPDLRGYGDSTVPPNALGNTPYSKREMAADITGLMDALGLTKASVIGHDRGARVAYRFALDHPDRLEQLVILEIVPTGDFWASWNAELAMAAYHWTFLAQPSPLPERMILGDGPGYIDWCLSHWNQAGDLSCFPPDALASYRAQGADPARVAAMCNDYRAGATIDREIDTADRAAGRTITAPLLFLWAEAGFPARTGDPLGLWRDWAPGVEGHSIPGVGHFIPEEAPTAICDAIVAFLAP